LTFVGHFAELVDRLLHLRQGVFSECADFLDRGAKCSIETLMKLCAALDVTPDYILMGTDKEYRNDPLNEIRDLIYRCDKSKRRLIIEFIKWYANQEIDYPFFHLPHVAVFADLIGEYGNTFKIPLTKLYIWYIFLLLDYINIYNNGNR
jgi:transcriptional regulator with XRE-family HTH domain